MKFIGKLISFPLFIVNLAASILMLLSSYGSLAAPFGKWPLASLSGLAFPIFLTINLLFLALWLFTWRKAALLPFLTIVICLVAFLDWCPIHPFVKIKVMQPYITVMTYNTQGFGIDDNHDSSADNPVLKHAVGLGADIIMIQETNETVFRNVQKYPKILNGYPYSVSNASGLSCISKYKIISHKTIPFPESGNQCLYLRLLIGPDTLAVYNCHLQSNGLNSDEISEYQQFIEHPTDTAHYSTSKEVLKKLLASSTLRAGQARMIADLAKAETARYVIVCGDFNDTPLSYSHRIFDRFMTDTYSKTGNGPGITYHEHRLYYRIDHIFCGKRMTPLHTKVERSQKDSDHYPVISKIRLE